MFTEIIIIIIIINKVRGHWPSGLVTLYLGRNDGEARGRSEDSKRRVRVYAIQGGTARSYHFVLSGRDVFAVCQACSLWLMMSCSMMSCVFHGDKRMVRYLPDPFSLFG